MKSLTTRYRQLKRELQYLKGYVDLDRTILGAVARDGLTLFDAQKQTAFDALRGASAMMGPRAEVTHAYPVSGESLAYRGYRTEEPLGAGMVSSAPLLDIAHGLLQLGRDPGVYDTLALARRLLTTNQPELARLTEAMIATARKGDAHPEAKILANAPLWDDLTPVIQRILERPALVNALMAAMELPTTAQLGASCCATPCAAATRAPRPRPLRSGCATAAARPTATARAMCSSCLRAAATKRKCACAATWRARW